jgi:hypothetical protein
MHGALQIKEYKLKFSHGVRMSFILLLRRRAIMSTNNNNNPFFVMESRCFLRCTDSISGNYLGTFKVGTFFCPLPPKCSLSLNPLHDFLFFAPLLRVTIGRAACEACSATWCAPEFHATLHSSRAALPMLTP